VDELMVLCDKLETQQQERERRFPVLSRACHTRFADSPTLANLKAIFEEAAAVSTEDLRRTVLSLAVQGKLVPQDRKDEDVERLLARSDERRREMAKKDRRAKTERMQLLSADDRWEITNRWSWRGLADLVLFIDYRGKTPAKLPSGIRLLTAKNVRRGEISLSPEEFLSEPDYDDWMTRGFPKVNDVLFTTEAPMGNAAVVNLTERFALPQRVICFRSYGAIAPSFLVMQFLSDQFQSILEKNATGMTAKGIKAAKLKRLPIAVPPLAEQQRIVSKVEQLMSLIEKMEAQQRNGAKVAEAFAQATVKAITGTEMKEREKMKAPKTELVSRLRASSKPKSADQAPLAGLLAKSKGELAAKTLWQQSGLEIEAFYQQLRIEMANGWIVEPEKAVMKEVKAN
jgi:type I restriction enzyme S subunit